MNQIEEQVIQILNAVTKRVSLPNKGDGWVNLADLGHDLRDNGIDYSKLGFDKLTSFLMSINRLELYRDERNALPVMFVKEGTGISSQENPVVKLKGVQTDPSRALMSWAFLGHFPNTLQKLKRLALDEDWGVVVNENHEELYPVLINYLQYTFYKLTKEKNKIIYSNDKEYAVFNTGLVDKRYKQIYALFRKNKNPKYSVKWYLMDFCFEGEGVAGKILVDQFRKMPSVAHYFNEITDMLYDTRMGKPQLDINHIIIERVNRLPYEFIQANAPRQFEVMNPACMSGEERKEYFEKLREAIKNDQKAYRNMTTGLENALSNSIERVKWNFKSAIPMYYPKKDKMCLFLPLCLVEDNRVDVALVVEKTNSGRYQGATIYELNWAYKCARLVCRPDSDWLTVAATGNDTENIV